MYEVNRTGPTPRSHEGIRSSPKKTKTTVRPSNVDCKSNIMPPNVPQHASAYTSARTPPNATPTRLTIIAFRCSGSAAAM